MKRLAFVAIILGQLWLSSPVCCCWLKACEPVGGAPAGAPSCCCSQTSDDNSPSPERDRDCRCSDNKLELPTPRAALLNQPNQQSRPWDLPVSVPTSLAWLTAPESPAPRDITTLPPPLSVGERLHELHRLNL